MTERTGLEREQATSLSLSQMMQQKVGSVGMARGVFASAMMIVAVTLVGRLFGFLRNVFISQQFGTGAAADAYYLALTLPLTFSLVVPGLVNALWIPAAKGLMAKGEEDRLRLLASQGLGLAIFFGGLLSGLVYLLAGGLVSLLAPGFGPEKAALAVLLVRWLAPSLLVIAVMGWYSAILNSHHHFFLPAFGSVLNSLAVLLAVWLWAPAYGIVGLTWGTLLGYVAGLLILLPLAWRWRYRDVGWPARPLPPEWKGMGERVVPLAIGAVLAQATLFLERFFASQLGDAKIAALSYAHSISQIPISLFVGAFTLPLFPLLAEQVKQENHRGVAEVYTKGLRYLAFLLIPTTAFLWWGGEPLVWLLYGRGAFDQQAAALTTSGLWGYSAGLFFIAARDLVTRAFYAYEDTRTPVRIGAVSILAYVLLAMGLSKVLDHAGVALSFSLAALVGAVLLMLLLYLRFQVPVAGDFWWTLGRTGVAVIGMLLGMQTVKWGTEEWPLYYALPLWIGVGGIVYAGLMWVMREPLLYDVLRRLRVRSR